MLFRRLDVLSQVDVARLPFASRVLFWGFCFAAMAMPSVCGVKAAEVGAASICNSQPSIQALSQSNFALGSERCERAMG